MGYLEQGQWHIGNLLPSKQGAFVRKPSQFRDWITTDGTSAFPAEADRYHLYLSYACPWSCRPLIVLALKKLMPIVTLGIVDPLMLEHGWMFTDNPGCGADHLNHCDYLYELYLKANPQYDGRVTVPVLWDKKAQTIVSNESADIMRMFNEVFNEYTDVSLDLYPEHLHADIDAINDEIYRGVNNAVYRCGFATSQAAYEAAYQMLFKTLDDLEQRLSYNRYLLGDQLTEADWRLFVTLVRFDPVYYSHFKCNMKQIRDYENLQNYLRELYQIPGIADTVRLDHIKMHYYRSHTELNPTGIVPVGPVVTWLAPHNRSLRA